jgi:type I restriction enzyme, S subunit
MTNGWQVQTLGAVCEVVNGGTPKTNISEYWDGPHRWITPAEMGKRPTPFVAQTARQLTEAGLRNSSAQLLPPNSVILSSRAPIGHLVINTVPMATNQGCKGLIPGRHLHYKFLYYYLSSIVNLLNALGTGTTFKEISGGKLKQVTMSVPPLTEQRRIVQMLDDASGSIATAKAGTSKNIANARALFESHLESVFAQNGKGWAEDQLDTLTEAESPITYGVVKPGTEGEIRFVRGGDLVGGKVRVDELRTISRTVSEQYRRTLLRGGELLICLVGQPGQVAVAPEELAGANIARQVGLIRLRKTMNAEFVRYFLESAPGAEALGARESGSVQQVINLGELRQLSVPHPSLPEQNEVVAKLNTLEADTQCLASLYERKLSALVALKKSLLHEAFSGRL